VDFVIRLLEPCLREVLVGSDILLNLQSFIQVFNVLIDTELIHFLIHSCPLLIIILFNFTFGHSLRLRSLFSGDSFSLFGFNQSYLLEFLSLLNFLLLLFLEVKSCLSISLLILFGFSLCLFEGQFLLLLLLLSLLLNLLDLHFLLLLKGSE